VELWNARRHSLRSCPPRDFIGSTAAERYPLGRSTRPLSPNNSRWFVSIRGQAACFQCSMSSSGYPVPFAFGSLIGSFGRSAGKSIGPIRLFFDKTRDLNIGSRCARRFVCFSWGVSFASYSRSSVFSRASDRRGRPNSVCSCRRSYGTRRGTRFARVHGAILYDPPQLNAIR